jgi:2-keto-4-pentenoate hydratase/2-oxohepta-3-ene-1,7-dioic acid hydratase in catechol pathway
MNVINFNEDRFGLVSGQMISDITEKIPHHTVLGACNWALEHQGSDLQSVLKACPTFSLNQVHINSPEKKPGKVVAAPINYKAHIEEMKNNGQAYGHVITDIRQAGLFLKAPSSVVGPSHGIEQRMLERRTDHEIELCAVIGKRVTKANLDNALEHVAGYCLGLDITVRGPEDRSFRKSMDTYTVLGPWLTTRDQIKNPQDIELELRVNGELRQKTNTSDMVMSMAELIVFATEFYTLEAGDVIMTGTPQGVGPIRPGDVIHAQGTHLGEMSVNVRAHA